ncbi:recombination regulator RecX [Corynebacterium felinum]|uniref:recombination regulator RecX n=1 Tax=Corynebacterium felinum TaxID=131318 RepID=UPI0023F9BDB1|nr:recombination regulator RecX [Corynebacterium felinum]MDF5820072.1 recombination regulator RecX [Corynebacterium felinum]
MSNSPRNSQAEKLARLEQALEHYQQHGSDLFNHAEDEAKQHVRRRALLLLDQRARSRHELRQRLLSLDFESDIVEAVLDDFEAAKLLDDRAFAQEWVRQRHERRGKSRKALDIELKDKGISAHIRAEALDQIDSNDEHNVATQLAMKKAREIKKPPVDFHEQQKYLRRIVGVLARRGFNEGLSFSIAKEALETRVSELET